MPKAYSVIDQILFDAAKKQLEAYEAFGQHSAELAEGRQYWEMAFSGAAIALTCAAMEGHANYLYHEATNGTHPLKKPLPKGGFQKGRWASLAEKWVILGECLTGRKVLSKGRPPFQGFCAAVRRRNQFIMHPKMYACELPDPPRVEDMNLPETKEFTVLNAQAAVESAAKTVLLLYRHLGTRPPRWAAYKPYTRMISARVQNAASRADKASPEDWFVPGS